MVAIVHPFICPLCGEATRVSDTDSRGDVILRTRTCQSRHKFVTREVYAYDTRKRKKRFAPLTDEEREAVRQAQGVKTLSSTAREFRIHRDTVRRIWGIKCIY